MPVLTLKIDIDTYRGTREGVPNLIRLLQKHRANATFLFSLGPDHTGWALRRAFRPGFFQKVARTSVLAHYGVKTMMSGVLLPAPDIGKACAAQMRAVRDAGFECGIHAWDHVRWQDNVRQRDAHWTAAQMQMAFDRFGEIFGTAPVTHGAAGWQMNEHAFARLEAFGMAYSADSRAPLTEAGELADPATGPYRVNLFGKPSSCIQLPGTLPTLDELLGRRIGGHVMDASNIVATLLRLTEQPREHVFTLHAELEGQKFAHIFDQLLAGWRAQGYDLGSMAEHHRRIADRILPTCAVRWGCLPGRASELIMQ